MRLLSASSGSVSSLSDDRHSQHGRKVCICSDVTSGLTGPLMASEVPHCTQCSSPTDPSTPRHSACNDPHYVHSLPLHALADLDPPTTSPRAQFSQVMPCHSSVPLIARIPDEILVEIFMRAREQSGYTWIAFSQVSYRWRSISLSHACLWTALDLRYFSLISRMLGRTQSKLELYLPYDFSNRLQIIHQANCLFKMFASQSNRHISVVDIQNKAVAQLPSLARLIVFSASYLTSITL